MKGIQLLHLVKAIQRARIQIGTTAAASNGWVTQRQIFGLIAIE